MEKYATLILYVGCCGGLGGGEFSFRNADLRNLDARSFKRYIELAQYARKIVDNNFYNNDNGHLEYGEKFVRDGEKEARKLIEWVLENIPNSEEIIRVIDQKHGKLNFFRQVRFNERTEKDKKDLVDKINSSGLGPVSYEYPKYTPHYTLEELWDRFLRFYS